VTVPVRPVILSGGAGTRLWPVSTTQNPKQFIDLLDMPLFDATVARSREIAGSGQISVVAGREQIDLVAAASQRLGIEFAEVIVEPAGRNTGPAIIAAALCAAPDEILVVLPSDHVIGDTPRFTAAVDAAVSLAVAGNLVTFGVPPTRPETGYGYLEQGAPIDGGYRVDRFREKPAADEAQAFVSDGRYLWNSGMFVFEASTILGEVERFRPDLLEAVTSALPVGDRAGLIELGPEFADIEGISIDDAVMEQTDMAAMVLLEAGWSDVGSWQSLWEVMEKSEDGSVMVGEVTAQEVSNSLIFSTSRRVAVAGVDGLVVVETPDAVLVLPLAESQMVRDLATRATPTVDE
jgi:mannose-1-phosphate guanylyltransferase/mannose-6-phosphate isomerase